MKPLELMTAIFCQGSDEELGNLAHHEEVETPIFCGDGAGGWNCEGKM